MRTSRMTGQIVKRVAKDGTVSYLIRIFLGCDAQTGRRVYFNKTIHGTKKQAESIRNQLLLDLEAGQLVKPSPQTLAEYLQDWLRDVAKQKLRERTFEIYSNYIRLYIKDTIGYRRLSDLRPFDIQNMYAKMQKEEYAPGTIRYVHTVLCSALQQAVKWRKIGSNPAKLVQLPRMERREMTALSPDSATKFLDACASDTWWGVLFAFELVTGARPAECLGVKWSDLDLEAGTVMIQRTAVYRKGGGWYFSETKTSRSRRTIPLPAFLIPLLNAHRKAWLANRLKVGPKYQDNDLVFCTSVGTPPMAACIVRKHFKPILKAAGLPNSIRLYDLRHSCATLLLAANQNPKVVSERLGHSNIATTMDVYSHVLPSMQRAASDELGRLLKRG